MNILQKCCIAIIALSAINAYANQHPSIYATPNDRDAIISKIDHQAWANESFETIRKAVEPYVIRHESDPEWIISRLAMYWRDGEHYTQCYLKKQNWDYGEGNAPVPTVRMPGMRTWNKWANVPLEQRKPYNESGDMLGYDIQHPDLSPVEVPYKESGHMIRSNNGEILDLAVKASFAYWITRDERYARFAGDIFNTWLAGTYYMNPILDPEQSTGGPGGYAPGGICGYYDYEQIHDDLGLRGALIYDFMFDYLSQHPHPHFAAIGMSTQTAAETVFKRFIELGMVRGAKQGNWNVNGWNMVLYPILVLRENTEYADGKGRDYYLNFLLKESTEWHDAIPDILQNYDSITGLWPESPGYSFGTVSMLLEWASPLRKSGYDILSQNKIIEKAALSVLPWMDSSANLIVFGDYRGGSANFSTFENLLSYYNSTNQLNQADAPIAALSKGIKLGKYSRAHQSIGAICSYTDSIPSGTPSSSERASYSPHHRVVTMKNADNLMATLYGGRNSHHLSANGLAITLYGNGYALVPDAAAYESYWSADHRYHQSNLGANTILQGYTEGDISINAMEPAPSDHNWIAPSGLSDYINFSDISAMEKRRILVLIKIDDTHGYYVDIFRSDLPENTYLFHNVGQSVVLTDTNGQPLPTEAADSISLIPAADSAWFTNIHKTVTPNTFVAKWNVTKDLTSRLWMLGADNREVFTATAPATTLNPQLTPNGVSCVPQGTPAILISQRSNAPFIGVYEYDGCISSVEPLSSGCGVKVSTIYDTIDYILSCPDIADTERKLSDTASKIKLEGTFGMVRKTSGVPTMLYLGNGNLISSDDISIRAKNPTYATIIQTADGWKYTASSPIYVKLKGKTFHLAPSNQPTLIQHRHK
jgi:hypothetical protein